MNEIPLMKLNNFIITATPAENINMSSNSYYGSFDIHELYTKGIIKQEERKSIQSLKGLRQKTV